MNEVSTFRLWVLRAMYLLIAVGLALMIGPLIFFVPKPPGHMAGVVRAVLAAVGLLAVLGLRYPLRMIPLLLFELVWKVIWLVAFALRYQAAGMLDPGIVDSVRDCLVGVILVPVALPWRYVFRHYLLGPGDRWK